MSLIRHYKLNGNTIDSIEYGDGVANNVNWVDGKTGKGVDVTRGAGNGIWYPYDSELNSKIFGISTVLSFSFWVYLREYSDYGIIVGNTSGRSYSTTTSAVWVNSDGIRYVLGTNESGNPSGSTSFVTDNPPLNQWHHVVCCSDNDNMYMYVNGNLVENRSISLSRPRSENTNGLQIGTPRRTYINEGINGIIDDVRIFDHTLTQKEVDVLYKLPSSIATFSKTGFSTPKLDTNHIGNSLYVKGSNGYNGVRSITFNQEERVNTTLDGLGLVIFNSDMTVASSGVFDIYDNTTARNALVNRMQNLGSTQFAVFATGGTKGIRSNAAIDAEFDRLGSWKWAKTSFLNNKPRLSYAAICHGTYGFVYESLNGSTSSEPASIIETTFGDINELGDNGFGTPIFQSDIEYNTNTTLLNTSIDFDTYLTVSAFMINSSTDTVSLEIEFFNGSNTSLGINQLNCDSVYLWQKYNALVDIPTGTTRMVIKTIHTGINARIDGIQVGKHNGFSPIPNDTLFSTNGMYSEKVSQSVHGYELFDTDWYNEQQSEMNVNKGIAFEQDVLSNVFWNDRVLTLDTERMVTQSTTSITLNSVSNISLNNKKPYFCALWVRGNKSSGSVSFGLRGSFLDSNSNSINDPEMVDIPYSRIGDEYKMMYFWLLPYTWNNDEVNDFKNTVSGYHESQFNLDDVNNGNVVQMTSSINTTKLFVSDKNNSSNSNVEFALPVIKEVSLLSFTTRKLEALNYIEM